MRGSKQTPANTPFQRLVSNRALLARVGFWFGIAALLVAVTATVFTVTIDRTGSDPRATLLVSQTLWKTGSIKLQVDERLLQRRYGGTIQSKNGHLYGYYPLGSSVLALPLVAVMNHFGVDVRDREGDARDQRLLVALSSMACAGLLVALARVYLSPCWGLLLAAVFWFGTSLSSTGATGLWSHDFGVVFALLAIYLVLSPSPESSRSAGFVVGGALFFAYFCRPTLALLAPTTLLYLWLRRRAWVWKCALTLAFGLALFVAFSWHEFGQLLPDYYLPERLSNSEFWTALGNNLVGPARGLFVYSPLLVLPLLFAASARRALRAHAWVSLIAVYWPLIHVIVISRFPHWWAGFSFGPRLSTDLLPGLFVLLCITIREAQVTFVRLLPSAVAFLALPSIAINSYQGLYNPATDLWDARPNIDENPQLLFDWRYPQFLATKARNARRLEEFKKEHPSAAHKRAHRAH